MFKKVITKKNNGYYYLNGRYQKKEDFIVNMLLDLDENRRDGNRNIYRCEFSEDIEGEEVEEFFEYKEYTAEQLDFVRKKAKKLSSRGHTGEVSAFSFMEINRGDEFEVRETKNRVRYFVKKHKKGIYRVFNEFGLLKKEKSLRIVDRYYDTDYIERYHIKKFQKFKQNLLKNCQAYKEGCYRNEKEYLAFVLGITTDKIKGMKTKEGLKYWRVENKIYFFNYKNILSIYNNFIPNYFDYYLPLDVLTNKISYDGAISELREVNGIYYSVNLTGISIETNNGIKKDIKQFSKGKYKIDGKGNYYTPDYKNLIENKDGVKFIKKELRVCCNCGKFYEPLNNIDFCVCKEGYKDKNILSFESYNLSKQQVINTDKLVFGVEIEKTGYLKDTYYLSNLIEKLKWEVHKDGSVEDFGGEFVSPVWTLSQFIKSKKEIEKICELEYDNSCGGHIHISKKGVENEKIIKKLLLFVNLFYFLYGERFKNKYSSIENQFNNIRYKPFNIDRDTNSVEIRLFPAVENYNCLLFRLKLINEIMHSKAETFEEANEQGLKILKKIKWKNSLNLSDDKIKEKLDNGINSSFAAIAKKITEYLKK